MRLTILAFALAILSSVAMCQSEPEAQGFSVASIKPSEPGEQSVIWRRPGGRLEATKTSVRTLIKWAYDLSESQLVPCPKWLGEVQFDIVAVPDKDAGNEQISRDRQIQAMTKTLLADRFGLRMHQEDKETVVLAMTAIPGRHEPAPTTHDPGPQFQIGTKDHLRTLTFQAASMTYVARWLSSQAGRLVVDQTGLQGTYDLQFSFAPETRRLAIAAANDAPAESLPEGPSIFTAIQKEAGLRLQKRLLKVPVWVIDSVTPPTGN